jgi:hypothetical protein
MIFPASSATARAHSLGMSLRCSKFTYCIISVSQQYCVTNLLQLKILFFEHICACMNHQCLGRIVNLGCLHDLNVHVGQSQQPRALQKIRRDMGRYHMLHGDLACGGPRVSQSTTI